MLFKVASRPADLPKPRAIYNGSSYTSIVSPIDGVFDGFTWRIAIITHPYTET